MSLTKIWMGALVLTIALFVAVTEANAQSNEQFQRDIQNQIYEQQRQQRAYQMDQWMIQDKMRLDAGAAANRARESVPNSTYLPPPYYQSPR